MNDIGLSVSTGPKARPVMILACSGCSYAGQLANRAAVELSREGFGRMSCLAALGAHLENYIQSARLAPRIAAINGCDVACTSCTLDHLGISHSTKIVVTHAGIPKKGQGDPAVEDVARVKEFVISTMKENAPDSTGRDISGSQI